MSSCKNVKLQKWQVSYKKCQVTKNVKLQKILF